MVTRYREPTSRPGTRYRPLLRVSAVEVYPVARFVTRTSAATMGSPVDSVTVPVIAPVVTPCANAWVADTARPSSRGRTLSQRHLFITLRLPVSEGTGKRPPNGWDGRRGLHFTGWLTQQPPGAADAE